MKHILGKKWVRIGLVVGVVIGIVYAMIYIDVVMRAREAYIEGEKYFMWHDHPEKKKEYLEAQLKKEIQDIEKELSRSKIDKAQYEQRIKVAQFNFQEALAESSIKYAYIWYQTAVELFSPPESTWVKRSRKKMIIAKEMWKEELRANKIPFEDYMLE